MLLAIPVTTPNGDEAIPGAVCIDLDTGEPITESKKKLYLIPGAPVMVMPRNEGGFWIVYRGELA